MEILNLTGRQFGQSELRELIAIGESGAVYRGYHSGQQKTVAVKILRPQLTQNPSAFTSNIEAAAQLDHTYILPIYEYGIEQDLGYITMRLVTGGTLAARRAQVIQNKRPLPSLRETAMFFREVATALEYAHSQNILHLDIKPSNIIFDAAGTAHLTDFGISRLKDSTLPAEPTPADDEYALVATIASLLVKTLPFDVTDPAYTIGDHLDEFTALLQTEYPKTADIMLPIFQKALASDPAARFSTILECSKAFDAVRPFPGPPTHFFSVYMIRASIPAELLSPRAADEPPVPESAEVSAAPESVSVVERVSMYKNPLYVFLAVLTVFFMGAMLLTLPDRGDKNKTGSAPELPPTLVPDPAVIERVNSGIQSNSAWTLVEREFNNLSMVQVPDGCFIMGNSNPGKEFEIPPHRVCISSFWIGQTEVTNAQYRACVDAGACEPPSDRTYFDDPAYDDYPVIFVNWEQANAFASWAGGSLPTDAQWEYAARGPDNWLYAWGNDRDGTRLNFCDTTCENDARVDTEYDDGYAMLAPVGSYDEGASWVGALDMAGNVWEWVADRYGRYPAESQIDPTGPDSGEDRILRGGSWTNKLDAARATYRLSADPMSRQPHVGFRIAMPAGQEL